MPGLRPHSRGARAAAIGALVCIGYYLGAQVGFALTLHPSPVSTLWPPNAILLSALLLAPPRHWWALLLAALPAHAAVELGAGVPWPMMLSWFVSNSSEALIGAAGVHLLLRGPLRFDSFEQIAVFLLFPALLAPFISSFLDAGLVTLNRFGESGYWQVWRTRFPSNVVAALTVVPVIVTLGGGGLDLFRRLSRRRLLEATALALALGAVCLAVFAWRPAGPPTEPSLLYAPLPMLLWAAVRFGPAGVSASLFGFAVFAIGGATQGLGPFDSSSPLQNALSVQLFLIITAVPLLTLAAAMQERERAQRQVDERLRFERLVSELLEPFATMEMERAEERLPSWLGRLAEVFGADRASVLVCPPGQGTLRTAHAWTAAGAEPLPATLGDREFPYVLGRLRRGEPVQAGALSELPDGGTIDREVLRAHGVGVALAIPLVVGGQLFGALVIAHRAPGRWGADAVPRLRWVAETFAHLLARKSVEGEVQRAEALNSAVLASLPGATAILDQAGTILRVGGRGQRGVSQHPPPFHRMAPRGNYLELCRELCEGGDTCAAELHRLVGAVLGGERGSVSAVCAGHGEEGEPRWYEIWIERLARREGGAIVTAFDVTARKQAELEAARHRDDLAHVVRVATMGELATSFTHELRQPLTAILANAQAGSRLLADRSPDLAELREIMADIGENDRRAGEALRRMRSLLRRSDLELQPVDMNELIRDVLRLLHSDLLLRRADALLDLDPQLPTVAGDRIHLQQVVLNLVLNALDAMEGTARPPHRLTIHSAPAGGAAVQIGVSDEGPGIPAGELGRIFDAFYTTKPNGLGMGLSIARTILEAHTGRIWATNNAQGGATVAFTLPLERGD